MLIELIIAGLILTGRCHGNINDKQGNINNNRNYDTSLSKTFTFPKTRDVPDALIDPYSVLGVLSFSVYIFYILYHKYRMGTGITPGSMGMGPITGMGTGPAGTGTSPPTGPKRGPNANNVGSDQNLLYLLDVASKLLSNAANVGGESFKNATLDTLDYYDEATDLQTSS